MNLNIDFYGSRSVLPVYCGNSRGTAFYIGNNKFLTAWHVVSDAKYDGTDIRLVFEGQDVYCRLIELAYMDVVLLESFIDIRDVEAIPLLKSEFKPGLDLEIIGFPQEVGNSIDYFGICVKNLRILRDGSRGFDTMVIRTEAFGFHSYVGFSGSPVLNESGYAVGIVTDQMHNTLGYTSICSIANELDKNRIVYEDNADIYDNRPYGLGTCIQLVRDSITRAKSRYNKELHIEDVVLEEELNYFCGLNVSLNREQLRENYIHWYNHIPAEYKVVVKGMSAFKKFMDEGLITDNFYSEVEFIAEYRRNKDTDDYFIRGTYRTTFLKLMDEIGRMQDVEALAKEKFLFVTGDAGCGKTHHLCHVVESLCQHVNVYLLFGTDFCASKDPERTISEVLKWESVNALKELNDELKIKDKYATFFIDALNEGAGTFLWNEKLPQLRCVFESYEKLKLVVSVRTMEPSDALRKQFKGWEIRSINGFSNVEKAIKKYFENSNITENPQDYINVREFQRPLFLKIFCKAFYSLPFENRKDIDILKLYHIYFYDRNHEVSLGTDEDPQRYVTLRMMYQIGDRSLLSYNCCDIPREKAIQIGNKLCHYRTWSKNLYHNLLKANLLMEYNTSDGMKTAFEYDSMGDYVRANSMLRYNEGDYERLSYLLRLVRELNKGTQNPEESNHIYNTIITFLSVWNPDHTIWKRKEFTDGVLTKMLLDSLMLRNMQSPRSTLNNDDIAAIVLEKDNYLKPSFIFKNFSLYRNHLIAPIHKKLLKMDMVERDERWTIYVNRLLDDHSYLYTINQVEINDDKDLQVYIQLLSWLLTSSHPRLRYNVVRKIHGILRNHHELCMQLIDQFYEVNDPYVLQGIYSAIYGVLLVARNIDLIHQVAELIYIRHYENQINVPSEISVRCWTLKILEFNSVLNLADTYWENSQPPYTRTDDLMGIPDGEDFEPDIYFGVGHGAQKLHMSLFTWDFSRYIIGTNSRSHSNTYIKDGHGVLLKNITNAVASRIKNVYGYSQLLSDYDDRVPYETSMTHLYERIGKKYQWISLGEVKAYLSDTCIMTKNRWNKELAEKPYPWYDDQRDSFDPTLKSTDNALGVDVELFEEVETPHITDENGDDWLESRENLPSSYIIVKDRAGKEWVNIVGYQKVRQTKGEEGRESFLYYCPCLVKNENIYAFEEWARKQNFYGRWMPENTGFHEFLWNEFPWSDSCKQVHNDEVEIYSHNAPCNVILPYCAQLQENRLAIEDEDDFNSTVYMPNVDMYAFHKLYTAERGITRNQEGVIVALNRNIDGDILDTLVFRRDFLDKYLEAKKLTLFYCNPGEKQLYSGSQLVAMQRLSGCLKYVPGGESIVIQKMTDERDFPKPAEKKLEESPIEGVPLDMWNQIEVSSKKDEILRFFHDLKLMEVNKEQGVEDTK
ncbi:serine protease [Bacteroides graminisolvens]|uniref:serine protease n=1 Tax=Bacteroides graminisolvens TaxID=477666 RepID=UPI00240A7868|nr:serine protease [Bacteroides graminisolvens]